MAVSFVFLCAEYLCRFRDRVACARQRRARRLDNVALLIGRALGGRPAEQLARRLGMPVSRDEILTNLRRTVPWNAESGPTRVIGIDEWSRRKGSDFGSIIVDLEPRQVINVLPDRAASSVEAWMRNHPDVEYVLRDRDGLYAEGATKAAVPHDRVWYEQQFTHAYGRKRHARIDVQSGSLVSRSRRERRDHPTGHRAWAPNRAQVDSPQGPTSVTADGTEDDHTIGGRGLSPPAMDRRMHPPPAAWTALQGHLRLLLPEARDSRFSFSA